MIDETSQPVYSSAVNTLRPAVPEGKSAAPVEGEENTPARETDLSDAEKQRLRELQARDREVRAHEQAHLSAAGGHAMGGASYTYERGPDQRMYAVGGEVQVDTSKVHNDPVATLRKAQAIRRAALAPTNPSSQDRQVAADAARMEAEARAEITAEKRTNLDDEPNSADSATAGSETSARASCPACGGAHIAGAHEGMTAYAAADASTAKDLITTT